MVYDITNQDSFARAKNWVKELQRQGNPDIVIALAGNKVDLEEERKITFEVGKNIILFFLHLSSFCCNPIDLF